MRYLIITFCLLVTFSSNAQEQLGLRTDNYSGIHGSLLNPAHNVNSKLSWDINLVGLGLSAHTNYGFIENSNVFHALRNADQVVLREDIENSPAPNQLVADFYRNNRLKYLTVFGNVMGPSFMVKLKNGHSFGLFTNVRTAFSTHDIPAVLNYTTFFQTPFNTFVDVDAFKISAMVWSEVGLNYAARIDTDDGYLGIGGNLKFINAFDAFYMNTKRLIPTAQIPGDTLLFQSPQLNYGVTKSNLEGDNLGPKTNGFGVGVDLGVTYVFEGDESHYKWKIGASLLDLGQIELSRNAEEHIIQSDSLIAFPSNQLEGISNQERIYLLSEQGLGDSIASLNSNNFRLGLPGAFSLQGDYKFAPYFYVSGVWVQRIPMGENSLRRNNLVAVTPRFSHRWFGAYLPISLLNYQKVNVGAALRIAFLTIGSDDIGSFYGKRNLDSTDFYVALKINPFDLNLNWGNGGKRSNRKGVKCYEF